MGKFRWLKFHHGVLQALRRPNCLLAPQHRIVYYVIENTWGLAAHSTPTRSTFKLNAKDAQKATGIVRQNWNRYYQPLLDLKVLYEKNGEVGVYEYPDEWGIFEEGESKRLQKRINLITKENQIDYNSEAEPAQEASLQEPLDKREIHEAKASWDENPSGEGEKQIPDKKPKASKKGSPERDLAVKLKDEFIRLRGYSDRTDLNKVIGMLRSFTAKGITEEQVIACFTFLATVDAWHKDVQHDWSLLRLKDKMEWFLKAKWKEAKPKTEASLTLKDYERLAREEMER